MPWNPQGGGKGPWGNVGGGGGGNSPWGRGGSGGPNPPDFEEMLRRSQDKIKQMMPGGFGGASGIIVVVLLVVMVWGLSGFYRVNTNEQGVVLRFGEYVRTTEPGLHYHLPYPIETALTPRVTEINRVEIGYRSLGEGRSPGSAKRGVPEESTMLTGDENIIDVHFSVFWRINDAGKYLFRVSDPPFTVRAVAESVLREVVGQTPIQQAFTEGRAVIESSVRDRLQTALDSYEAGVEIVQVQLEAADPPSVVVDAFNDVQRARADMERLRNEAEAYRNAVIPQARGEAEAMVQQAMAFREQVVNRALGESARFIAVYEAYANAREVTAKRLYLETMEEVLANSNKIILDGPNANAQGVLPYLPLNELMRRQPQTRVEAETPRQAQQAQGQVPVLQRGGGTANTGGFQR